MTSQELFENYLGIKAETKQMEEKLFELHGKGFSYATDSVSGCSDEEPYQKHQVMIGGATQSRSVQAEAKRLESRYNAKIKELLFWKNKAEDILEKIPDAKARVIIRYHFIDGLEWSEVADKLYDTDKKSTENSVKQYCCRTLRNL